MEFELIEQDQAENALPQPRIEENQSQPQNENNNQNNQNSDFDLTDDEILDKC